MFKKTLFILCIFISNSQLFAGNHEKCEQLFFAGNIGGNGSYTICNAEWQLYMNASYREDVAGMRKAMEAVGKCKSEFMELCEAILDETYGWGYPNCKKDSDLLVERMAYLNVSLKTRTL